MADISIQMKQRNGEIWDNLYPKTKAENVIETTTKKFVSDAEKTAWNDKATSADVVAAVNGHAEEYTQVHGATALATPNALMSRDSVGRAKIVAPVDSEDIARKDTVDTALAAAKSYTDTHANNKTNPHGVTKADLGLSSVENKSSATIRGEITSTNVTTALGFTPLNTTSKGAKNGLAELDANGFVPSSQLPSYVDDVLEYDSKTSFPVTGETGKIYVALDTNIIYRWGSTAYIEISASLALGETSSTAYRGDRGKIAYDHSQAAHAPATAQKNSDITKTEIEAKLTGTITTHTHAGLTPGTHASSHVTGGTDIIPNAAASGNAGLMSGADKAKLDGVAANANNYTHPTTAGNKHIPTGGAAGQVLAYSGSSGTASWKALTPQDVGAVKTTVSATEPTTPSSNDLWYAIV